MSKIEVIDWIDSTTQDHQVDRRNFPKPAQIRSVGFIVEENSDYLVLARDDMGDGDYRGLLTIPKICILPKAES